MSLQFSISPDFNADQLSQWFIFNTWMQRALARPIHFEPSTNGWPPRRGASPTWPRPCASPPPMRQTSR